MDRRRKGPDGQPLSEDSFVFDDGTGKKMSRRVAHTLWTRTREKAGISRDADGRFTLRFHDLRRESASQLLESGATLQEVRETLGHTTIGMTGRYVKAGELGLKTAFEKRTAMQMRKKMKVV